MPYFPPATSASSYVQQAYTDGFTVPANMDVPFGMDIDLSSSTLDLTINGQLIGVT